MSTNKWQISDGSDQSERRDSNEETPNLSTIRLVNKGGRRSADFLTSLKNVKNDKEKIALLDFGESNKFSSWYDVWSSTKKRGKSYRVHLKQDISYPCKCFAQKNTPCKHLLYVYLFVLNLPEDSAVLQQVHLSGSELMEMFSNKVLKSVDNCPKLTPKALLRSTSTVGYTQIPNQSKTPLNKKMTAKLPVPQPQDDPYWIIGKTGNISKCCGCSEELKGWRCFRSHGVRLLPSRKKRK